MKLTFAALATLILLFAPAAQAAPRPDLRVTALTAAGSTSITVANAGRAGARRSVLRLVLSADARRDRRDRVLARANVRALARGRKTQVTVKVALPATPAAYVLACADDLGKVREARETNNCRAARLPAAAQPAPAPAPSAPASSPAASAPAATPATSSCAATDTPDLAHVDSDCDGVDGTAAGSIFVSPAGADADPGTQAAPKRTIAAGIAAAAQSGRAAVLIAAGQYPGRPVLVNGISLYGGYDRSPGSARMST